MSIATVTRVDTVAVSEKRVVNADQHVYQSIQIVHLEYQADFAVKQPSVDGCFGHDANGTSSIFVEVHCGPLPL